MVEFFTAFWQALLSQAGVVAVMLALGIVYQTRELKKERDETKKLNAQILKLATSQVSAMNELQAVLRGVTSLIGKGGN